MTSTLRRAVLPGIAAVALSLTITACGSSDDTSANDSSGAGSGGGSLSGTLSGGGSSAQQSAQAAWMAGFQQQNSGVTVNYDAVGSGTGRTNFFSGAYAFAGSDAALSDEKDPATGKVEIDEAKQRCGADALEVPVYVSPIAIVYNLPGVDSLQLSPATVGDIFSGKITTWNDSEIAADNPGVDLPSTTITPVHRSDDSGTTQNFTDWLSATAGSSWKYPADDTWPINGGASGEQTSGLVTKVKGGEGAIGYADFSQSGGLGVAAIKVGDSYNMPSADGAAQALNDSPLATGRPDGDFAVDIDRTDTTAGAYPLFLASYLIMCPSYDDASTAALVKGYATYVLSEAGQEAAASTAGSAPVPQELAQKAQAFVDKIGS